ncbi:MAG: ABC transporter substrate-binding protein [Pseudomonadota bacterium]
MTYAKLSAAMLSSAAMLVTATSAQALDEITFQLDWLPGGDKSPIYVCIEQGFCEEAGISVTIEGGRGSSEAVTKLATGISDIGTAGLGALMAARATEDVPVTAVMSYFNKGPHAFYTLEGNEIETVEDVRGTTIATSPFTSSNVYLPLILADMGMTEEDITLNKMDPGALGPTLMTGQADAIIAWVVDVTRYTTQAEEAGHDIKVIPWSTAGLDLYSASVIANDTFLEERPDVARRFLEAYQRSVAFAHENPAEAAASVVAVVPELDLAAIEGGVNDAMELVFNDVTEVDGFGVFEPERLASTWVRVAAAQGFEADAIDPESIVDRSFMPTN